ncbi:hypothetical protein IW262DRAFT_1469943 [Armillaria fumosa]|nr:hypothetical protein IW262DRAFT_1469943 [Armillaria fumosa]
MSQTWASSMFADSGRLHFNAHSYAPVHTREDELARCTCFILVGTRRVRYKPIPRGECNNGLSSSLVMLGTSRDGNERAQATCRNLGDSGFAFLLGDDVSPSGEHSPEIGSRRHIDVRPARFFGVWPAILYLHQNSSLRSRCQRQGFIDSEFARDMHRRASPPTSKCILGVFFCKVNLTKPLATWEHGKYEKVSDFVWYLRLILVGY